MPRTEGYQAGIEAEAASEGELALVAGMTFLLLTGVEPSLRCLPVAACGGKTMPDPCCCNLLSSTELHHVGEGLQLQQVAADSLPDAVRAGQMLGSKLGQFSGSRAAGSNSRDGQ